ncbi:hypothetical protein HS088_TW12G01058 [Tripterygium wilfordii]|uniref:Uncharacterized protein n=1 Tax=Tripterygium wilfordii TaxID=458696 RepID=A0A7J7D0H4_TRIWF|nr:uncharacterized protein LOC120011581 [Tripterygium wilfordii]XP_038718658.1 uncharacterized protein LOC120011581 [Tripterygium wilfordii]XP_038718659.1 uncharacterized protein LOC120011581 [Tripterygium wilfordii]XP_038718661.1 uncharacterized protein LOC120011581 [Tripterygium wilfordii]KAF5739847.1 hypothetical protein HS088_TW12G01058 [Tripterygium wilfordii]
MKFKEKFCSTAAETMNPWPFRLKLTRDHIRWDSLKIPPSRDFEAHILENLDEASRRVLDAWGSVQVSIFDADTCDTHKVNLVKKKAFWFEPFPDVGQRKGKQKTFSCNDDEFAYSIEPFKMIVKKRNLSCDQEIGFRWSGNYPVKRLDFSVLYVPSLDMYNLKIERLMLVWERNHIEEKQI